MHEQIWRIPCHTVCDTFSRLYGERRNHIYPFIYDTVTINKCIPQQALLKAFITMVVMPFSFSISDGILIGMISYVLLNALCGNFKNITPTMWVLATLFVLRYIFI